MPSSAIEEIRLVRKLLRRGAFVLFALVIVMLLLSFYKLGTDHKTSGNYDGKIYQLAIPNKGYDSEDRSRSLKLKAAYSNAAKAKGLSGTKSLGNRDGMIFIFDQTSEQCFWMKDMRYPIDIIWVDSQKKVVSLRHSVNPNTYPESYCHSAQYVIELNAGVAAQSDIDIGDVLQF